MRDYFNFPERIYISDLTFINTINLSIFGRIEYMSRNIPKSEDNNKDRFPVRLVDTTGSADITMWESIGRTFSCNRVGQVTRIYCLIAIH